MRDEEVVVVIVAAICVLVLYAVILVGLTSGSRKRQRATVAAQRDEVPARLRSRQQQSPPLRPASTTPAQADPATPVQERSRPATLQAPPRLPAPVSSVLAPPTVNPRPRIVTRTGPSTGGVLEDPFAKYGERAFSRTEDVQLIRHYIAGQTIAGIAVAMQLDTKQIASRLIRLLFSATGRLDTDDDAPRAHKRYEGWEVERMREAYAAAVPLERLAAELGRSPLGLGWRMLDLHIPTVPHAVRRRLLG